MHGPHGPCYIEIMNAGPSILRLLPLGALALGLLLRLAR
jgi:hypothetical protein